MEHIVQFGINIDDEAIKKYVVEMATKDLKSKLEEDIKSIVAGQPWMFSNKVKEYAEKYADQFFTENKEEIIERTANKLMEKLARTKAVKEMLEDTLNKI